MPTAIVPTRPTNIRTTSTIWAAGGSVGVMPVRQARRWRTPRSPRTAPGRTAGRSISLEGQRAGGDQRHAEQRDRDGLPLGRSRRSAGWPITTSGSPRSSAQITKASRKNVVTLMPPAVLALPPPMNISAVVTAIVSGVHVAQVDGVEAAGAGHHVLEERGQDLAGARRAGRACPGCSTRRPGTPAKPITSRAPGCRTRSAGCASTSAPACGTRGPARTAPGSRCAPADRPRASAARRSTGRRRSRIRLSLSTARSRRC